MNPASIHKYRPFQTVQVPDRTWPDNTITRAPIWCSVDLRDGNQALPVPMSVEEKLEFFDLLVRVGFKQIEIGFPSAADTEFNFLRRLIEENRIPSDVTVQVLVQAREHLILRTIESLIGAKSAIIHLYTPTNPAQREIVLGLTKDEVRDMAVEGASLIRELCAKHPETHWQMEFSPETFVLTEPEFALEICEAVSDAWGATPERKIILNLPLTVEAGTPNTHADQIEWFCRRLRNRLSAIISLHTHNDRGTGVAATELALLAGAERVEGTLFGNGERTGNLDIVTVALNMNSHGLETGLNFSDLPALRSVYERVTRLKVPERQPYAGELVFTAFSGSHQDAIKKGFDRREKFLAETNGVVPWDVPYLTIDPQDIGRSYEAIIRINSQSGKGGVAYVLDREHGFDLPKTMHPQVGKRIYDLADRLGRELSVDEIRGAFFAEFVNISSPLAVLDDYDLRHHIAERGQVQCSATIVIHGEERRIEGLGNGPINAFVHAIGSAGLKDFKVTDYRSHAVRDGSDASAAAYVQLQADDGRIVWGAGVDPSIEMAGLRALVSAWNLLR